MPDNTIHKIVMETCEAIYTVLRNIYMKVGLQFTNARFSLHSLIPARTSSYHFITSFWYCFNMADDDRNNGSQGQPAGHSNGLEDFITNQCAQQRTVRGADPGDNIDEEKISRFLSRALAESRRMSSEVEKSQAKTDKLRTELGEERMEIWRREHAAEVQAQQQAILAEKQQQH